MWELLDGEAQSLRVGLLGFVERTAWPGTTFNRSIDHTDGVLTIPRVTLLSNARLGVPKTPLSFRYLGYLHVNPLDPADVRGQLQGSLDVRIAGPLHIGLSGQLSGSSVVLEGGDAGGHSHDGGTVADAAENGVRPIWLLTGLGDTMSRLNRDQLE